MARAENKQEVVLHQVQVNPKTRVVIRHIETAQGKNFLDLRQAFRPDAEEEDDNGTLEEDYNWQFTRYGVRLDSKAWEKISGFVFPKDPVDTKTVTTRIDPSIMKLPPVAATATEDKPKVRSTRPKAAAKG